MRGRPVEWGPGVGEQLRFSEQENERMRADQTRGLPCAGKFFSKVVTIYFIWMLANSEIVP